MLHYTGYQRNKYHQKGKYNKVITVLWLHLPFRCDRSTKYTVIKSWFSKYYKMLFTKRLFHSWKLIFYVWIRDKKLRSANNFGFFCIRVLYIFSVCNNILHSVPFLVMLIIYKRYTLCSNRQNVCLQRSQSI